MCSEIELLCDSCSASLSKTQSLVVVFFFSYLPNVSFKTHWGLRLLIGKRSLIYTHTGTWLLFRIAVRCWLGIAKTLALMVVTGYACNLKYLWMKKTFSIELAESRNFYFCYTHVISLQEFSWNEGLLVFG